MSFKGQAAPVQPGSKQHALMSILNTFMNSPPRSADRERDGDEDGDAPVRSHFPLFRRGTRKNPTKHDPAQHHFEKAFETGHHDSTSHELRVQLVEQKSMAEYIEEVRTVTRRIYDNILTQIFIALLILGV
eukprot:2864095-Rhodomonas_salina.1